MKNVGMNADIATLKGRSAFSSGVSIDYWPAVAAFAATLVANFATLTMAR